MYFIKPLGGIAPSAENPGSNLIRWNQQIELSKQIYDNSEIAFIYTGDDRLDLCVAEQN